MNSIALNIPELDAEGFKQLCLANENLQLERASTWMSNEKWDGLTQQQREEEFSPLAPDFVVELRSSSDSLKKLQKKMAEYIENGVSLGWLIDPKNKTVEIYRQGKQVEILEFPQTVSGEDVLPGFELNLNKIW